MKKTRKYRLIIFLATFIVMAGGVFGVFMLLGHLSGAMHPAAVADISQVVAPAVLSPATVATMTAAAATVKPPVKKNDPPPLEPPPQPSSSPDMASLAFSLSGLSSLLSLFNHMTPPVATSTAPATTTAPVPTPPPVALATTTVQATTTITVPFSQNGFSDMAGWQRTWGSVAVASDSLEIGATTSTAGTTGGEAILPGSSDWNNYVFTATIDLVSGETFSLEAQRDSEGDYFSCSFSNGGDIDDYLNEGDNQYSLASGHASDFAFGTPVTASIRVVNGQVACALNGATVPESVSYGLPTGMLSGGGIGVLAWAPTPGTAELLLEDISVTQP